MAGKSSARENNFADRIGRLNCVRCCHHNLAIVNIIVCTGTYQNIIGRIIFNKFNALNLK